jgi:hypothetical protein
LDRVSVTVGSPQHQLIGFPMDKISPAKCAAALDRDRPCTVNSTRSI